MKYRTPTHDGDVWIHIDNIHRKDGKVWAVQWREDGRPRYETVPVINIGAVPLLSRYDHRAREPRAYLWAANACVEIVEGVAYVLARRADVGGSGAGGSEPAGRNTGPVAVDGGVTGV